MLVSHKAANNTLDQSVTLIPWYANKSWSISTYPWIPDAIHEYEHSGGTDAEKFKWVCSLVEQRNEWTRHQELGKLGSRAFAGQFYISEQRRMWMLNKFPYSS